MPNHTLPPSLDEIRALRPEKAQDRLSPDLRARTEWSFSRDMSGARVRGDETSARLCRALGAPAVTVEDTVHVDPAVIRPDSPEVQEIMCHELAHVAQFSGSAPVATTSLVLPETEADADLAAEAAMRGQRYPVRPRGDLAVVNYPWWVVFAAIAALGVGASIYGGSQAQDSRRKKAEAEARKAAADGELTGDEREKIVKKYVEPRVHETWYGMIPFWGSMHQIGQAENVWEAVGGVSFLLLDCTLVGGMAMKTFGKSTAQVTTRSITMNSVDELSAVLTKPSPEVTKVFQEVAKGGGTATQREAFKVLLDAMGRGELKMLGKEAAEQAVTQSTKGGTAILAGTRGPTHHSMVFVIHNGEVFRLHGGPLARVFNYGKSQTLQKVAQSESFLKGWNNVTVYGADHLKGLTGNQITNFLAQWQGRTTGINRVMNHLFAPGCSSTAGYTLKTLKAPVALKAGDTMIPVLLDRALMQGPGLHFALNNTLGHSMASGLHRGLPWLVGKGGQTIAPSLETAGFGSMREAQSNFLFTQKVGLDRHSNNRIGIVEEKDNGSQIVQSLYVLEPVPYLDLERVPLNYGDFNLYAPGIFDVPLPDKLKGR